MQVGDNHKIVIKWLRLGDIYIVTRTSTHFERRSTTEPNTTTFLGHPLGCDVGERTLSECEDERKSMAICPY